jgi:inhibitor of KinA sporulation pathway (predicted exonuclease)
MYTRQEASHMRKKFWTSFGQYMRPLPGANGETVNWLNYKTGIKHLYFRMDADTERASVSIEIRHPDLLLQQQYFQKLRQVKNMLEEQTGEEWQWQLHQSEEDGKIISRIISAVENVNIFDTNDWPTIISFLKPRLLALDKFWYEVKDVF